MHKLGVVHGNLRVVRPFPHLRFVQALTYLWQKNVLVDANGHACVAGLGIAFRPFDMSGGDIDWYFHGLAPELVDSSLPTLTRLPPTKDSDVYAFGVLAWEVSPALECLMCELLTEWGSLGFRSASAVPRIRDQRSYHDGGGGASTAPSRTSLPFRWYMGDDRGMLEQ
jgi:hypothetical protein